MMQQVSASDFAPNPIPVSSDKSSVCASSIARRGFNRDYEKFFYIGETTTVMSDMNWDIGADTSVTVRIKESNDPTRFFVGVWYGENDGEYSSLAKHGYLNIGESFSCNIPEDYDFKVVATATEGVNGNATFNVILDD